MKKICAFLLVLILLLGSVFPVVAVGEDAADVTETTAPTVAVQQSTEAPISVPLQADGDASVSNGCNTLDAAVPLGSNEIIVSTAKSAFLYELETDTVIYMWNPDLQVYPASLTKLMTCLIAVERGNLDDVVTVRQETLDTLPWDAAVADFVDGEQLTLRDLLYATMVSSANDAAAVIAEHIAGDQQAFVALMNERAAALGCSNTNFTNPHGLHDDQQYTTARDLARIMREALKNEDFFEFFNEDYHVIDSTNLCEDQRPLFTSNYMMSTLIAEEFYDYRVTGGKTGVTANDGWSLVSTAEEAGVSLLSIVLDAESVYDEDGYSVRVYGNLEDTAALIDYGFDNFKTADLIYEGQSLKQYSVTNGENDVVVGATASISSALPINAEFEDLRFEYILYDTLQAPLEKGKAVGVAQIWHNAICLAQCEMITLSPVSLTTVTEKQNTEANDADTDGGIGNILMILGIVFLIVLGVVILFVAMILVRSAMIRARRRKRRMNRRRSR